MVLTKVKEIEAEKTFELRRIAVQKRLDINMDSTFFNSLLKAKKSVFSNGMIMVGEIIRAKNSNIAIESIEAEEEVFDSNGKLTETRSFGKWERKVEFRGKERWTCGEISAVQ